MTPLHLVQSRAEEERIERQVALEEAVFTLVAAHNLLLDFYSDHLANDRRQRVRCDSRLKRANKLLTKGRDRAFAALEELRSLKGEPA
jgi:hypothetical protein